MFLGAVSFCERAALNVAWQMDDAKVDTLGTGELHWKSQSVAVRQCTHAGGDTALRGLKNCKLIVARLPGDASDCRQPR